MANELTATFGKPFAAAIAAFLLRLETLVPTERWDDIWQDQHDRAFMVAGVNKADLLADIAAAIFKARSSGTGLEAFRKDFYRIVEERGWLNYTGSETKKGRAWRTRVIYQTNMATSYAAGRMAQLVERKFPLWIYFHGGSMEPRVIHLGWDGLTLPPEHPFWATHSPPNGWGCSCYIIGARSFRGAQRLGGQPGKQLPDGWQKLDPKTGAPVGIDRGWAYAPGASVAQDILALKSKLEALPPQLSIAVIQDWVRSTLFSRWFENPVGNFPLARVTDAQAVRIGAEVRVAEISAETALKQKRAHPELSVLEYASAQRVIDTATEVIQDSPTTLVFVLAEPGTTGQVLIVKATKTGKGLFVTSFRRLSGDTSLLQRTLKRLRHREIK